ncbi:hypothetical protein D3C76_1620300 [compost metagenome]
MENPGAAAEPSPSWMPSSSTPSPATIMATMASTFTSDSQNSSSPNTRTLHRLSAAMHSTMPSTQIQRGVSGNHKPM